MNLSSVLSLYIFFSSILCIATPDLDAIVKSLCENSEYGKLTFVKEMKPIGTKYKGFQYKVLLRATVKEEPIASVNYYEYEHDKGKLGCIHHIHMPSTSLDIVQYLVGLALIHLKSKNVEYIKFEKNEDIEKFLKKALSQKNIPDKMYTSSDCTMACDEVQKMITFLENKENT